MQLHCQVVLGWWNQPWHIFVPKQHSSWRRRVNENTYKVRPELDFSSRLFRGILQVSSILSYTLDDFERMDTQSDAPWKSDIFHTWMVWVIYSGFHPKSGKSNMVQEMFTHPKQPFKTMDFLNFILDPGYIGYTQPSSNGISISGGSKSSE